MYTPVSRNGILFNVKDFMLSICLYCTQILSKIVAY